MMNNDSRHVQGGHCGPLREFTLQELSKITKNLSDDGSALDLRNTKQQC
jgi:hypothetical protein